MPVEKKIKKTKSLRQPADGAKKTTSVVKKKTASTTKKKVVTKTTTPAKKKVGAAKKKATTIAKKKTTPVKKPSVKKIKEDKMEKVEKVPVRSRIKVKIETTPKPKMGIEQRKFKEAAKKEIREIDEAELEKSLHGINLEELKSSKKEYKLTSPSEEHHEHRHHHEDEELEYEDHRHHHHDEEDDNEEDEEDEEDEERYENEEDEYYDEEEEEVRHHKKAATYSPGAGFTRSEMAPSFNQLHEDVNRKNKEYDRQHHRHEEVHDRSIGLYKKIAFSFVGLTLILLAVVLYFSLVKVNISIIPVQERISSNMIFDVRDESASKEDNLSKKSVTGVVRNVTIESNKEYIATGKEIVGQEAVGKVTIFNNYTRNQPLVASTRLITADSKLFRIKNTVNVPAGGSIEVEIYADKPSADMEIAPTKFTIPGLWAGLQDKIYAESEESIVYGEKIKRHVSRTDIEGAIAETKERLLNDAKIQLNSNFSEYDQIIFDIDENSIKTEVDADAGENVDKFTVNMTADVILVAFSSNNISKVAKQKFISSLTENKELLTFDQDNIIYSLNSYDSVEGVATINSTFEGRISLRENSEIVEIDKIIGLNNRQLDTYLAGIPEIAGYDVEFYPSFVKKVPKLVDRIKIDIQK